MYKHIKSAALAVALGGAVSIFSGGGAAGQSVSVTAGAISKTQAVTIAEAAVPGAKFQAVMFDRFDQPPHWSVDLFNSVHDYEVWVSTTGKVLRIIVQPH